eukprot:gene61330-81753_t
MRDDLRRVWPAVDVVAEGDEPLLAFDVQAVLGNAGLERQQLLETAAGQVWKARRVRGIPVHNATGAIGNPERSEPDHATQRRGEPFVTNLSVRRHRNFYLAIAAGAIAGLGSLPLARDLSLSLGVNAFFVVYLGLTYVTVPKLTASFLRQHAAQEDEP